jgi:ricin-type beta-trefoil lectin protein
MWVFISGGALLTAGILLITFAVLRPDGGEASGKINLASAPAPTTESAPTTTAAPTQTSTPTQTRTKKPRATVTRTKTEAPKTEEAKPKPKAKREGKKKAAPIRPAANNDYVLRNVVTGKCIAPLTQAAVVTQVECADAGRLNLEATRSESGAKLFRFRGAGANICLDVPEAGAQPSATDISAFDCSNPSTNDNQEWELKDTGKVSRGQAVFTVVNLKSGNCLDVANLAADKSDRAAGLKLTIFTCAGAAEEFDDHLWTFD